MKTSKGQEEKESSYFLSAENAKTQSGEKIGKEPEKNTALKKELKEEKHPSQDAERLSQGLSLPNGLSILSAFASGDGSPLMLAPSLDLAPLLASLNSWSEAAISSRSTKDASSAVLKSFVSGLLHDTSSINDALRTEDTAETKNNLLVATSLHASLPLLQSSATATSPWSATAAVSEKEDLTVGEKDELILDALAEDGEKRLSAHSSTVKAPLSAASSDDRLLKSEQGFKSEQGSKSDQGSINEQGSENNQLLNNDLPLHNDQPLHNNNAPPTALAPSSPPPTHISDPPANVLCAPTSPRPLTSLFRPPFPSPSSPIHRPFLSPPSPLSPPSFSPSRPSMRPPQSTLSASPTIPVALRQNHSVGPSVMSYNSVDFRTAFLHSVPSFQPQPLSPKPSAPAEETEGSFDFRKARLKTTIHEVESLKLAGLGFNRLGEASIQAIRQKIGLRHQQRE
eukprot:CAMPEP_0175077882 /NCGR_PEP_ID=MMETSP0052_2-20121109/23717_1 /TAXON_ID=51329 ORGANISM="Polytomella parva, Strain SAG 63-3" /NCGR_SAMPLE_ID=MMETSP0052_2 /ASSEMBLY_ACC=CAM_ASM_000194 /LENGTH=453 /DNA_ID=CAMNT_0016347557 /DNA_START=129 /DNA_END=1486 /DNA_ORIENTATION=+